MAITVPELQANTQHVYVSESSISEDGSQVEITLSYISEDPDLTGLGFWLYFDTSILSLNSVTDLFSENAAAEGDFDTADHLVFAWASFTGTWPGSNEAKLATVTFDRLPRVQQAPQKYFSLQEVSQLVTYLMASHMM